MNRTRLLSGLLVGMGAAVLALPAGARAQGDPPALDSLIRAVLQEGGPDGLAGDGARGPALSPFGGESQLPPGDLTPAHLTATFEFVINVGPGRAPADTDLDGTVDITGGTFRFSPGTPETVTPLPQLEPILTNGWVPNAGLPDPPSTFDALLGRLGIDAGVTGPQDALGTQVRVIGPPRAASGVPIAGPLVVWGGTTESPLPLVGCDGNILELGRADRMVGLAEWEPGTFAPMTCSPERRGPSSTAATPPIGRWPASTTTVTSSPAAHRAR